MPKTKYRILITIHIVFLSGIVFFSCVRAGWDTNSTQRADASRFNDSKANQFFDVARTVDTRPDLSSDGVLSDISLATHCGSQSPLIFCETFEGDLTSGQGSVYSTNGGQVTQTKEQICKGKQALKCQSSTKKDSFAWIRFPLSQALTTGELHLRTYVYFAEGFTVDNWVVVISFDGMNSKVSADLIYQERLQIVNNSIDANQYLEYQITDSNFITRNQWHCLEFVDYLDAAAGRLELWVDGQKALQTIKSVNTITQGGISSIRVGITHFNTSVSKTPITLFLDDIAAGYQKIGCD